MTIEDFKGYTRCSCGAITLFANDGNSYSCKRRNLKKYAPFIDLRKLKRFHGSGYLTSCCDHCVNHYGLDICACGSGEPTHKCKGGFDVCGKPMQVLGEYTRVCASGALVNE